MKPTEGSWEPAFDELDGMPSMLASGFREVYPSAVAEFGLNLTRRWELRPFEVDWWRYRWLQVNYRRLIGLTSFIFRPGTDLTRRWLIEVERRLDRLAEPLRREPARFPKERPGHVYDGEPSRYPIPWTHLLADVLHPLLLRDHRRVLQSVPRPKPVPYI